VGSRGGVAGRVCVVGVCAPLPLHKCGVVGAHQPAFMSPCRESHRNLKAVKARRTELENTLNSQAENVPQPVSQVDEGPAFKNAPLNFWQVSRYRM